MSKKSNLTSKALSINNLRAKNWFILKKYILPVNSFYCREDGRVRDIYYYIPFRG